MKYSVLGKCFTLLLLVLVALDFGSAPQAQRKRAKSKVKLKAGVRSKVKTGVKSKVKPKPKEKPPYRLGIHHPHPALCPGEESSQRDLRILRMAFDVGRTARDWQELPWFYAYSKKTRRNLSKGRPLDLVLDTPRLWESPEEAPKPGTPFPTLQLTQWRLGTGFPTGLKAPAPASEMSRLQVSGYGPFLASRLSQNQNLPYRSLKPPAPGEDPPEFPECRSWPKGIEFETPQKKPGQIWRNLSYRMKGPATNRGRPYELLAFREARVMWGEYLSGRLDALLLEGTSYEKNMQNLENDIFGTWGLQKGGQQIVLRFSPRMMALFSLEDRRAISLALNREDIANSNGENRFSGAVGFLEPLLKKHLRSRAAIFSWNTRLARKLWVKSEKKLDELTLGVLDHPLLKKIADGIQAHLIRTINLPVTVVPYHVNQFQGALESGEVDLMLEVADLEDGSLQDLWISQGADDSTSNIKGKKSNKTSAKSKQRKSLRRESIQDYEFRLRNKLPYLPILINNHYLLLAKKPPPYIFRQLCPDCRRIPSPMRLKESPYR